MVATTENEEPITIIEKYDLTRRQINLTAWILRAAVEKNISDVQIRREVQTQMGISNGYMCLFETAAKDAPVPIKSIYMKRASQYFTNLLGEPVTIGLNDTDEKPVGLFAIRS
jgi:hypothetical protein